MDYNEKKSVFLRKERDRALFEAYNKAVSEKAFCSQAEAIDYARTHAAPRFYIDGEFCYMVLCRIRAGKPAGVSGFNQVRKFNELYRRAQEIRQAPRYSRYSFRELCDILVEQSAPEFYISGRSARGIISRERDRVCREVLKRARH